jgi:2-oxoglutarate dehydrogenase E2 component (dihydrolipoamide succinyltransferase)
MSIEVKVPQLAGIRRMPRIAWHKKPGDSVGRDENLVDLETDKVVLEVPAPSAGVIKELRVDSGATVHQRTGVRHHRSGRGRAVANATARERRRRSPRPAKN